MARPKIHGERIALTLRLPTSLAEKLEADAQEMGLSRNDWIIAHLDGDSATAPSPGSQGDAELEWWRQFSTKVEVGSDLPKVNSPLMGYRFRVELVTPRTQDAPPHKRVSDVSNCAHKYRVRRGSESVCPACGDVR